MPFQPGQSGNPGGRPKEVGEVRALARQYTGQAIATLAAIMLDDSAKGSERVAAATALLDRGYGKPAQAIVGGGEGEAPIEAKLIVEYVAANPITG